ncbi:MAG: hypothetical protein VCF07_09825 [Nitrospinota bacterium]
MPGQTLENHLPDGTHLRPFYNLNLLDLFLDGGFQSRAGPQKEREAQHNNPAADSGCMDIGYRIIGMSLVAPAPHSFVSSFISREAGKGKNIAPP